MRFFSVQQGFPRLVGVNFDLQALQLVQVPLIIKQFTIEMK